jgi:pantothenate kinase
VLVGLDGWHLTRAQLDAMPDPVEARARRGAHWTFDGEGYVACIRELRKDVARPHATVRASWHQDSDDVPGGSGAIVRIPTFDHAVKDPVPDAVAIYPRHRIVVIEGLYSFLDIEPWRDAGEMLDERWLIRVDESTARTRLIKRHVLTGVTENLEEATKRADDNDMPSKPTTAHELYRR